MGMWAGDVALPTVTSTPTACGKSPVDVRGCRLGEIVIDHLKAQEVH